MTADHELSLAVASAQDLPAPRELREYRRATSTAVPEVVEVLQDGDGEKVQARLQSILFDPDLCRVLQLLPQGVGGVANALVAEAGNFQPGLSSSVADMTTLVQILLLSQIDTLWWGGNVPFETDADVLAASELVDLDPMRKEGQIGFAYTRQAEGWPSRATAWSRRRFLPHRQPHTAGLRFTRTRPECVALLNQLSTQCRHAIGSHHPPLWVTSLVRSVHHQHHLRTLGYSAVLPSAHCSGHAIDIEVRWFERFGAARVLTTLLLDCQEAGLANVIDEGNTWHVCVNPAAQDTLRHEFVSSTQG